MTDGGTRGVVFDLDDTLVFERDYVRSGFRAIADACAATASVTSDSVFAFLWDDFEAGVRGKSFDRLLAQFAPLATTLAVPDLVAIYRDHTPTLTLRPEAAQVIEALRARGVRLGLISDGPLASQSRKVKAVGLEPLFSPIVLTDAWGASFWKPHRRAFEEIERAWGLPPENLVYVGDNPLKDFVAPRAMGWHTVRLRVPEQLRFAEEAASRDYDAVVTTTSLADIATW